MTKKIQAFLVVLATIGVLVFNWMAAEGILGGIETGAVSDRYPTPVTPADYAFSIWGLIYAGLIVFTVYQALPRNIERFGPVRSAYIFSSAANCAWLYFWHHEMILACAAVIFVLLAALAFINVKLRRTDSLADYWLARVPFEIYFGWVTAAAIINAAVVPVYLNVEMTAAGRAALGAVLVGLAAAIGVFVRIALKSYFYPLAIAWALTAIAVKQSGTTPVVVAAAAGVIACLLAAVSFLMTPERK